MRWGVARAGAGGGALLSLTLALPPGAAPARRVRVRAADGALRAAAACDAGVSLSYPEPGVTEIDALLPGAPLELVPVSLGGERPDGPEGEGTVATMR